MKNISEKIAKAKEKTKDKKGVELRVARKQVKRLQRAKRKVAVAEKRQLGKKGATPPAA